MHVCEYACDFVGIHLDQKQTKKNALNESNKALYVPTWMRRYWVVLDVPFFIHARVKQSDDVDAFVANRVINDMASIRELPIPFAYFTNVNAEFWTRR